MQPGTDPTSRRKGLMALFSRARAEEIAPLVDKAGTLGDIRPIKGPETGMVLLRGRIGGGGSPFPLGEVTVSRASVALGDALIGHGHVLGTDRKAALDAAIADAAAQHPGLFALAETIGERISARLDAEDAGLAAETAATRVDFFTLVRGED